MAGGFFDKVNKGWLNRKIRLGSKAEQMPAEKRDKLWDIAIIKWLVKKYSKQNHSLVATDCSVASIFDNGDGYVDWASQWTLLPLVGNNISGNGWFLWPRPVDPVPLDSQTYGIILLTQDELGAPHTHYERRDISNGLPISLPTHPSNQVKISLKIVQVVAGQTFLIGTDSYLDQSKVDYLVQTDFHLGDKPLNPQLNWYILEFGALGCESVDLSSLAGGWTSLVPVGQSIFVSDVLGNDATGTRARFDKMFKTVAAALAVYQNGDTIFVYPGNYIANGPLVTPPSPCNIHCFNGVTINSLPEGDLFQIWGWLNLTGDGIFKSFGSGVGNHAVFRINPTVKETINIEAQLINWSKDGVVIQAVPFGTQIFIESRDGIIVKRTWVDIAWSHSVDIKCNVDAPLPVNNLSTGLVKVRGKLLAALSTNPAYFQDASANAEFYGAIFVGGSTSTYAINTNGPTNVKLYATSFANLPANPDFNMLINTPLVIDPNVT